MALLLLQFFFWLTYVIITLASCLVITVAWVYWPEVMDYRNKRKLEREKHDGL